MNKNLGEILESEGNIFVEKLKAKDIEFLKDLPNKKNSLNQTLKSTESQREKMLKTMTENKNSIDNNPKGTREYINGYETALESIEDIYKNLIRLQNTYIDVEKISLIIAEKWQFNYEMSKLSTDLTILSEKIGLAEFYEQNFEKDNEKNYLIINAFMKQPTEVKINIENPVKFNELNEDNIKDNLVLRVLEKEKRVELPYTRKEVLEFMKEYPSEYKTVQDVIKKEFMMHISLFNNHPILARFREAYYLCRNKEMQSIFESFIYAKSMMFKSEISPYIIAAVKSKKQLDEYIECLENNKLDEYKYFKIVFKVNPLSIKTQKNQY